MKKLLIVLVLCLAGVSSCDDTDDEADITYRCYTTGNYYYSKTECYEQ